jgi:hypothetical protein
MHNALRGAERKLTDREKEVYLTYSTRNTHLRPLVRAYPNVVHWAELAQDQRELYERLIDDLLDNEKRVLEERAAGRRL